MLRIVVGAEEHWDSESEKFVHVGGLELELEHSLATLSKWEEIHKKPFLRQGEKSSEEVLSYVECMIQTPDVPADILYRLSQENVDAISAYMEDSMTATRVNENLPQARSRETITAELIHFWLISAGIPPEPYHRWHLNKLFTLLKVFEVKSKKDKKLTPSERDALSRRNAEINRKRLEMYGGDG